MVLEIQKALEALVKGREDYALDLVNTFKDVVSDYDFRDQISTDISEKLQSGLIDYLREIRSSNEQIQCEIERTKKDILFQLKTIERKDLKELREDNDLKDPSVGLI